MDTIITIPREVMLEMLETLEAILQVMGIVVAMEVTGAAEINYYNNSMNQFLMQLPRNCYCTKRDKLYKRTDITYKRKCLVSKSMKESCKNA